MMRKTVSVAVSLLFLLVLAPVAVGATTPLEVGFGDVDLSGGFQAGHFDDVWNLVECDLTISFTYDANGLVDDFGGGAHAWAQMGLRQVGYGDFNPTWDVEGAGVWLATDYDWTANTFDPDPVGSPSLDLDDKLILQKAGGHGEADYNLPSTPPAPGNNHRVWFDRDGVDPWQASNPLAVNGGTYNTGGTYYVEITLQATSDTTGEAYMTINGLDQGFETDGDWNTMELTPAGMTWTGDMTQMQVFYGIFGYGATHSVSFEDITVSGCLAGYPHYKATGSVGYTAKGLQRYAKFDAHYDAPGKFPERGEFHYSDVLGQWYDVDVKYVSVSMDASGETYFFFAGPVVAASKAEWLSNWFSGAVYDGGTPGRKGDMIWGIFTDQPTAQYNVANHILPGSAYAITSGNLKIHT